MLDLILYLAVLVIVVILIWYLLGQAGLPEPLNKIITIAVVVVAAVVLIGILLSLTGSGGIPLRLR